MALLHHRSSLHDVLDDSLIPNIHSCPASIGETEQ